MSDMKMYDILGKFNNLDPEFKPLDKVTPSEPVYQEVDPRGSITEGIKKLQENFETFKLSEAPSKKKSPKKQVDTPQDVQSDLLNIDSSDPELKRLKTQARFYKPTAKNDFEAIASYVAKQEKELDRAKAAEEEDRTLIKKTQEVSDQMNDRFKKLNAKVAAGQITAQDVAAAKAAQEIEKSADAAKQDIAKDPNAPVKDIAEPELPKVKQPAKEPEAPKATAKDASPYTYKTKSTAGKTTTNPLPANDKAPGLAIANPIYNPALAAKSTAADLTPANDEAPASPAPAGNDANYSKYLTVLPSELRQLAAANDQEKIANPTYNPANDKAPGLAVAAEGIEFDQSQMTIGQKNGVAVAKFMMDHNHYQSAQKTTNLKLTPPPNSVKLEFSGGRALNLSLPTVLKLLGSLKRRGVSPQEKNNFFNYTLSDPDQLLAYIKNVNAPQVKPKKPPVKKGQTLDMFAEPQIQRQFSTFPGTQDVAEDKYTKYSGQNIMKKPNTIAEAVKQIEEKYMGFKAVEKAAKKGGAKDPAAVAASIGREKYGKKKFQKAAAAGKKLGENFERGAEMIMAAVIAQIEKYNSTRLIPDDFEEIAERIGHGFTADDVKELISNKNFVKNLKAYQKQLDSKISLPTYESKKLGESIETVYEEEGPIEIGAQTDKKAEYDMEGDHVKASLHTLIRNAQRLEKNLKGDENLPEWVEEKVAQAKGMLSAATEYMLSQHERNHEQATGQEGIHEGKKLKDKKQFDNTAETGDYYVTSKGNKVIKTKTGIKHEKVHAADKEDDDLDEVAPPGAKAERMVKHIKKAYSKDGKLTPKEKSIAYATAWKAHNKGQVEEAVKFGDTVKNSTGKMTKVKVAEGKEAIRQHPIYTDKNAWDHYKKELDEQEMMDGVRDVQQELDEIAKLAGVPIACPKCSSAPCKCEEACHTCNESPCACSEAVIMDETPMMDEGHCPACDCNPCKCDEGMMDETAELDEVQTRKDFEMVAGLIKNLENREKAKDLAHHHDKIFAKSNPRYDSKKFFAACGLEECDWNMNPSMTPVEEEMETEGNEFSGALAKAKEAGEKEFEVDGKKYTVKEDITLNVSATGEEDALNLIRKLSGMAEVHAQPIIAVGEQEAELDEQHANHNVVNRMERDVENLNTPREDYAAADITTMTGTGLDKKKTEIEFAPPPGDNPLQAKKKHSEIGEAALWQKYEDMLNEITK